MFFVSTSNITKLFDKNNSYSFEYQKNSYFILGCTAVVQEGNIRKTMAARGLVNGRGPRSGRDLVFRCYPPELLLTPKKKEADLLGQPLSCFMYSGYFASAVLGAANVTESIGMLSPAAASAGPLRIAL